MNILTKKYIYFFSIITVLFLIFYGSISKIYLHNDIEFNIDYIINKASLSSDSEILYLNFEKHLGENCEVILLDEYLF